MNRFATRTRWLWIFTAIFAGLLLPSRGRTACRWSAFSRSGTWIDQELAPLPTNAMRSCRADLRALKGYVPLSMRLWGCVPAISGYTRDPKIRKLMAVCIQNGRRYKRRKHRCLHWVKKDFDTIGLGSYLKDEIFADSTPDSLRRMRMVNLLKTRFKDRIRSPADAPDGAVLVYAWSHRRGTYVKDIQDGHIEIKTPQGYCSDYLGKKPVSSDSRAFRLIGVYVKPYGFGR